jgi:hypothetical protein
MGYPNGLFIDATKGTPTDNNIPASLFVQNTIIAGCPNPVIFDRGTNATTPVHGTWTQTDIIAWFNTPAYGNSILTNCSDAMLTAPFNYTAPDFNPAAGSPAATGASFTNTKLTGFQQVAYKGACATGDTWWKTWTKY